MIKFQQKFLTKNTNIFNIDYSFHSLVKLICSKEDFLYNPSEIFLKENDGNHWLFNEEKQIVWRPSLYISNSIDIKLLNNSIYVDNIIEHPDVIQPLILDNQFDIDNKLISVSYDDFFNKKIFD
jgi:hypothetical protein